MNYASSLFEKFGWQKTDVSKLMSLGTVPPPSGQNITPETLKLCVAMVEGTQRNEILTDEM